MKKGVFWDVTPCGSCKNRRFGGTWRLLHQVTRIGELGTTQAATSNRRTLPTLADRRVSRGQRSGTPKALKKGVFWDVTP
jgi:hypothetical protein